MAVPIIKVIYQQRKNAKATDGVSFDVTDILTYNAQEGLNGATNNLQITLNNPFGKYSLSNGDFTQFYEGDTFSIYADYDPIDTTSTNKLIKVFTVRKVQSNLEYNRSISLECVDFTYLLLSGLISQAYDFTTSAQNDVPALILDMIKNRVINNVGNYQITAALSSSGGYVQAYAPTAYDDGSSETGTLLAGHPTSADNFANWRCELGHAFYAAGTPSGTGACGSNLCTATNYYHLMYSPLFKSVYDSMREISQNLYTKYSINRAFVFYVDKNAALHWFYPALTLNSNAIVEGDINTKMIDLNFSTFEGYNMIIYNCGKDINGNGILGYKFLSTSGTGVPKMKYVPMLEVATTLKAQLTAAGTYAGTSNADFRKMCKTNADNKAVALISRYGQPRLQGSVRLRGTHNYRAGDLVTVTSPSLDLSGRKLRVYDVQHTINNTDWQTTLQIQEDDYTTLDLQTVI